MITILKNNLNYDYSKFNWISTNHNLQIKILKWIYGNIEHLNKNEENELLKLITNKNNSGQIGETIFKKYLDYKQIKYQEQFKYKNRIFDFKTNDTIYEIKFGLYNMSGTAYEKILNVPHKYRNDIETNKLIIVLIGKQELEDQELFNDDPNNLKYLELFSKQNTYFIKFSSLISEIYNESLTQINNQIHPFIKWVGGKSRLIDKIISKIPTDKTIYCEPFIGSGSVLFAVLNNLSKFSFKKFIINDINPHLIITYVAIKNHVNELINELKKLELLNDSENFYDLRDEFNNSKMTVRHCALFVYLNKTCFRGLYRENKKGQFNVPYGNYKSLNFDYENLINVSKIFNQIDIKFYHRNYEDFIKSGEHVFYYLDPPYLDTFNDYTKFEFDSDKFYEHLSTIKHVIFSNSDEFLIKFPDLKSDFQIEQININDSINSKKPNKQRYEILGFK